MTSRPFQLLAVGVALGACADETGTDVGNPVTTTFALASDGRQIVDQSGARFEIDSATLRVTGLRLVLPDGERCDTAGVSPPVQCVDGTLRVPGNIRYDLLTGQSQRPVEIPDLAYPSIEFSIRSQGNEPGLRVRGTGDVGQRIDVRLGATGPITVNAGDASVVFDARTWFAEVDLAACIAAGRLPEQGGASVVDEAGGEGPCEGLAGVLVERVPGSAR